MGKEKKIKKHEKIREEINRMRKTDNYYCNINNCSPNDFMKGKTKVYTELINFINKI